MAVDETIETYKAKMLLRFPVWNRQKTGGSELTCRGGALCIAIDRDREFQAAYGASTGPA
jgi:hypothetical protein